MNGVLLGTDHNGVYIWTGARIGSLSLSFSSAYLSPRYLSLATTFLWPPLFSSPYLLVSAFLWCQHCSGASIALVPALLWCQHCSGASIALVPALLWCQHCSGASIALVSAFFWYLVPELRASHKRACHELPTPSSPTLASL